MGKNPHAKKLKEKKFKEREYSNDIEALEEEAARRGISVFELEKVQKDLEKKSSDEEEDEEADKGEKE
jgi:hypothetical protein